LLRKTAEHWPLLLAQLLMFSYVYPEARDRVPAAVVNGLLERARADVDRPRSAEPITRGTLVSRFSFAIDVNEWGLRDLRREAVHAAEQSAIIRNIATSEVWQERSEAVEDYLRRIRPED